MTNGVRGCVHAPQLRMCRRCFPRTGPTHSLTPSHTPADASCLKDAACVQITWAPSHPDKCVMYQSINDQYTVGAQGWVKCQQSDTDPEACTGKHPPAPPAPPGGAPAENLRTTFKAPADVSSVCLAHPPCSPLWHSKPPREHEPPFGSLGHAVPVSCRMGRSVPERCGRRASSCPAVRRAGAPHAGWGATATAPHHLGHSLHESWVAVAS